VHLTIDGYGGDRGRLASESVIRGLLRRYLADLGVAVTEPHVQRQEDAAALSGFVVAADCHITIHTAADRGRAWVDIFIGADFDAAWAILSLKEALGLREVTTRLLARGPDAPDDDELLAGT
jgi:S-adenosylmethionine decarboxylase